MYDYLDFSADSTYFRTSILTPIGTNAFTQVINLTLPIVSNFLPVSYGGNVEQHVLSKYCRSWIGFLILFVWSVERMAHDGVVRTASMSLGATESAISSSEVRINLVASVPEFHSLLGYLMLVGLRFRPYDVHRSLKWSLICFH